MTSGPEALAPLKREDSMILTSYGKPLASGLTQKHFKKGQSWHRDAA